MLLRLRPCIGRTQFVMLSRPDSSLPGLIRHHLQPSRAETIKQLQRIVNRFGVTGAAEVFGLPVVTVKRWLGVNGQLSNAATRRVIWLHYVLLFEPDTIQTVFDLATWGRFKRVPIGSNHKSSGS